VSSTMAAAVQPLFGNVASSSSSKALVEFRAGKMQMASGTKLVTPDKRKGMVQIEKGNDNLMHFKWKDRGTGTVEDDLIIFPDDIEYTRVKQCTTGRVYVLKFKSSPSRRMFFWMQEPKEDKDEEYCKKVNDVLNKPARSERHHAHPGGAASALEGSDGGVDLSSLGDAELQNYLGNMNQQQLMQLLGGGLSSLGGSGLFGEALAGNDSPSTPVSASTRSATQTPKNESSVATPQAPSRPTNKKQDGKGSVQLSDLQSILSGIKVPEKDKSPSVDLSKGGITSETVKPLLNNPDFVEKMKTLLPKVEEGDVANAISSEVTSPQFQQSLAMFSSGLQTGQLAPLIREFNLGDAAVAAATAGDMEAFIQALQNEEEKKENANENTDAEMKDA